MSPVVHTCAGVAPRGANRRHISPGLPTCGHDSWAQSSWCAQPTPINGAQARHGRQHDAQPDHDRAAWYGKHIRGLFVLGMVVGQRVEQDLELVEISQLNRQLRSDLRVRNELKEGLQCLLEVLNREPFNCGWCEIRRMQWARRHRRDSATVRSIGSTRNCRHARHKQAAVRYYCKAGCDRSTSGLCCTYILSNVAADVALDSLHVVVAADVAYRVSFAFRESLRISRAERAVQR